VLVVSLRNAQASAVAEILDRILAPADQQADTALARAVQEQVRRLAVHRESADVALRLDLTKPIRVIADPALNALVISSTPSNAEALRELAEMFDRLPLTDSVTVQLFPLQNIAADRFAAIVRDLFSQGKQLGQVPGSETGWIEPRVIELLYADATELAETLSAILVDGAADRSQATPLQRQVARLRLARLDENGGRVLEADLYAPMSRLVIRPEPKINALVLVGTPMNLEVVSELVQMLDVEAAAPGALVRIYPVEHASATRLAVTITRLFDQQVASGAIRSEDRVILSADERTNALVVTTSPRSFGVLEPLLASLDSAVAPEFGAIRRIELVNASAARVGQIIQEMMDDRLERLRRVEPETADLERATIVPDLRTNSLIVGAGTESFEIIKMIAEDLDRFTLDDHALVRILPVVRNNVERIAETVDALMDRRYAELPADIRDSQKPLVLTDPRSNSLLVAASPEDCQAIHDLVEKLEAQPMNPAIGLHVIQITGSRVELLGPRLQSLMQQRQQSLGGASTPSDRVSIQPDTASNSLIVAASEENIEVVRDLIDALSVADEDRDPDTGFEMIQLLSSRASDMEDLLQDLYVGEANRRRGRETVRVTADERLNALLVNAPDIDLAAIKRLVSQLDGAKPSTVIEIKFIALTSANSLETVGLIENVLSGRGIGTRTTPRQATVMKYLREFAVGTKGDGEGGSFDQMEVSAAVREAIQLTPDLRTTRTPWRWPRSSPTSSTSSFRAISTCSSRVSCPYPAKHSPPGSNPSAPSSPSGAWA
jgi:type II secretory pathway component GspD/PulD (secretin)